MPIRPPMTKRTSPRCPNCESDIHGNRVFNRYGDCVLIDCGCGRCLHIAIPSPRRTRVQRWYAQFTNDRQPWNVRLGLDRVTGVLR